MIAFARAVAEEGRPDGVRCNAIVPTQIDTPANRAAMPESEHHKLVPPERIANVIAFLCSDDIGGRQRRRPAASNPRRT